MLMSHRITPSKVPLFLFVSKEWNLSAFESMLLDISGKSTDKFEQFLVRCYILIICLRCTCAKCWLRIKL